MDSTLTWLLEGDVAIQYLTHRDLLKSSEVVCKALQSRIPEEGFGAAYLAAQNPSGHWGIFYYQTKWTCTHYTLLELYHLGAPPGLSPCRDMVLRMLKECQTPDGALYLTRTKESLDLAVEGMALTYAVYFCPEDPRLLPLADHLLSFQLPSGGYSWDPLGKSADPHSTLCVLEGLAKFQKVHPQYRPQAMALALSAGATYFLDRELFLEHSDPRFRKLAYPHRYRYDLLRILEYFAREHTPYDPRMEPALSWLKKKMSPDHTWPLELIHPGAVHFSLEPKGAPSRFITLKGLMILSYFKELPEALEIKQASR
ncbi:hypothetical protein KCG48_10365 [Proteiniclasticum sp. BAD-10]|uniref:Squalene cyclase C-terminal domain-containing protein n=1 Tax=Proteiniclasticum sediminis TaxID=2804028 RepID=A0A941CQ68_9CLOT|nr:hypothetical protein [Proteiniclasticum sediminis]MBR0576735.1 hypothetical protein [Proteiniclasticum sediminis]